MKIYHQVTRYRSSTGKPYLRWEFKEIRCDFSGRVIDEDLNSHSYPNYNLQYDDQDPCFGSGGDEYHFGQEYGVDMFEFLSGTYHFITGSYNEDGEYVDYNACVEMMKSLINKNISFDAMCRASRIKTAIKLIKEGTILPEQLYEH